MSLRSILFGQRRRLRARREETLLTFSGIWSLFSSYAVIVDVLIQVLPKLGPRRVLRIVITRVDAEFAVTTVRRYSPTRRLL